MTSAKFLLIIIIVISILGCKSKINQIKDHQREGRWVNTDTLDYIYITKGKYHKGKEVGTWKHFYNDKMVRKEKYRKEICKTVFYYPNGKVMKKGSTKVESNANEDHWYYFGKWYFYNINGKLDSIKNYKKEDLSDHENFVDTKN